MNLFIKFSGVGRKGNQDIILTVFYPLWKKVDMLDAESYDRKIGTCAVVLRTEGSLVSKKAGNSAIATDKRQEKRKF